MSFREQEALKSQIIEAHAKIVITCSAHYKMVDRFESLNGAIKNTQIILTALSTVGFFSLVILNQYWLALISGIMSAISLALNLYMRGSDLNGKIKSHKEAADALWSVRELYLSLITDFNDLTIEDARKKRDSLIERCSEIYAKYPGTDKRAYNKAKKDLDNDEQTFKKGEAERFLPTALR